MLRLTVDGIAAGMKNTGVARIRYASAPLSATTITAVDVVRLGGSMNDTDTGLDRRTFLKRSAVGSLGLAGWAAQDESDSARLTWRMAFRKSGRLDEEYVRKIVLLTDRKNADPDPSRVDGCAFSDWPTDRLVLWEGIIIDWKHAGQSVGFYGGNPTVEATQLIERNDMYLDQKSTQIPLGTPYIIDSVVDCPGELVGVNATQIPGVEIKTGPGESTQG